MGFHICEFCQRQDLQLAGEMEFGPYSSADVTLQFASGRSWQFPHVGLLHYVTKHKYRPPDEFVEDVMGGRLLESRFGQTKSPPTLVGYLQGPGYPTGDVPQDFVGKLSTLVEEAKKSSGFRQTRGIDRNS